MKKNLLFLLLSPFLFNVSVSAQETKISFESSEGFVLGSFNGQKGWSNWGYVDNDHSKIVNTISTDGSNSVEVTPNENQEENWGGIFYNAPGYRKMLISADVYLDSRNAADYDMLTLYSMDVEEYERLGGFYFNFNGGIEIGGEVGYVTTPSWTAKKWYNLKVTIDFTTKKIDYYLDNVKTASSTFNAGINSIKEFDFELDNYKSGYKVDNVKIQNLENLSTSELSEKSLKIYPNPVHDILKIEAKEKIEFILVFDAAGKQVLSASSVTQLNVESLSSGVYLIKMKTKNTEFTEKFIKK